MMLLKPKLHSRRAMGFVEVLIAVLVVAACAVPVVYMVTSSRTETSKAIHYLRAVELANEVIEWASVTEFSQLDNNAFSSVRGPLVEEDGAGFAPMKVLLAAPAHPVWNKDGLMASVLQYSEQYNNAWFFREVEISDVSSGYLQNDMLKKVTVRVKWSEAHRPANPNLPHDRNRQVEMSVLLLNDKNLMY
ncbi:hypothetical protein MASR1M12_42520 [Erysipelotrichia bacterium]